MKIKYLGNPILVITFLFLVVSSLLINYSFQTDIYQSVYKKSNFLLNGTFQANFLSFILFSILFFYFGKLNFSSLHLNVKKVLIGVVLTIVIWLVPTLVSIVYSLSNTDIEFYQYLRILSSKFIAQFFGNTLNEEFIFRGVLLLQFYLIFKPKYTKKKAMTVALLVSQTIFMLLHIPNRLLVHQYYAYHLDLIFVLVFGIVISLVYIKTTNLIFLMGLHSFMNEPYNIIVNDFPFEIVMAVCAVLSVLFYNKIYYFVFREENKSEILQELRE